MDSEELIVALVNLSRSDNKFDAYELTYILNVGAELGLDQEKIEYLIKSSSEAELKPPANEQERMTILYYLLFLMKIDQNVSEEERKMIHHYGFKLGFSRSMINDFITLIERHLDGKVPVEGMLNIIKTYKN